MNNGLIEKLIDINGVDNVLVDEPMNKHTTFLIGGPASAFVMPDSEDKIKKTIRLLEENEEKYYIIGNGSNMLVSDDGFDGTIVQILDNYSDYGIVEVDDIPEKAKNVDLYCNEDTVFVKAQAGVRNIRFGRYLTENSLSGFEFANGIPGTIGGAVMMNAGAYGGEIKDIVACVNVLKSDGTTEYLTPEELELGYRTSNITKNGYIVLDAVFALKKGDKNEIKKSVDELAFKRRTKQPLEYPSAGSTFKRPEGHFAAQLIDEAGLRGYTVGGAQVSEKHAGFVVNRGTATAKDVIELTDYIRNSVYDRTGIELELEVRKLGF